MWFYFFLGHGLSVSLFNTVVVWMSENVYQKLSGRRDCLNGDMIVDWFEFSNWPLTFCCDIVDNNAMLLFHRCTIARYQISSSRASLKLYLLA